MLRVGLTGGIGSGKSTVAARLVEHGFTVIDADAVAREVVGLGEPALTEIAERFGQDVLQADGGLDRAKLAAIVFVDEQARRDLEAITHPRIGARIRERMEAAEKQDPQGVIVLDHPLLVETRQTDALDAVIVVEAPVETRVRRLVDQRGIDEQDARARLEAQTSDEERRAAASHVIRNHGTREELRAQIDEVAEDLRRRAGR